MANSIGRITPQSKRMAVWSVGMRSEGSVGWTDNSKKARRRSSQSFTVFGYKDSREDLIFDEEHYMYLGMEDRFDLAIFFLLSGTSLDYFEWDYFDGVNWIEFVPGIEYEFYETGGERFDRLQGWRKSLVRKHFDVEGDEVSTSNSVPDTILRYWIRVRGIPRENSTGHKPVQIQGVAIRQYATYCTVEEVQELLQIEGPFNEASRPSYNTVEDYIHNAQSYIDYRSRKSWRVNLIHNEEHQFNRLGQRLVKHYPVEVLKAEIWDGSTYEIKIQGRGEEYFLVPETSMVYWARFFLLPARLQAHAGSIYGWYVGEFNFPVRFTYLHGSNIFDNEREGGMVNDVAKKLAAIDIIQSMDFTVLTPGNANIIDMNRKSDLWRAEVEEKIDSLISFTTF